MWEENEAPLWRWILAALLSLILGAVLGSILGSGVSSLPFLRDGCYLAPERPLLAGISVFLGILLVFTAFLRLICRTSLRAFLFGRDRKPEWKKAWTAGGLFFAALILVQIPLLQNITFDTSALKAAPVNLLFCVLFLWIQTTTEEIFFRVLFLRVPYRNEVPSLPKGLSVAVISSLIFMSAHLYNPEVTTQSGVGFFFTAATYFAMGFFMFLANLLTGGTECGLVLHLVNNFFCFVFVRAEVTALMTPALFVDHTKNELGYWRFVSTLFVFVLPIGYLLREHRETEAAGKNRENMI